MDEVREEYPSHALTVASQLRTHTKFFQSFVLEFISKLDHPLVSLVRDTFATKKCDKGRIIFPLLSSGFASSVRVLGQAITIAMETHRCVIVSSIGRQWPYANSSVCQQADLSCYFIGYPRHKLQLLAALASQRPVNGQVAQLSWGSQARTWWVEWISSTRRMTSDSWSASPRQDLTILPFLTAGRPRAYLMQLYSEWLEKAVNLTRPFVGVHVRQGDKSREAYVLPLSAYVPAIVRAMGLLHTQSVHIATDNATLITVDLPRYAHIMRWHYVKYDRPGADSFLTEADRRDPERLFRKAYFELLLLVHADFFIGTLSSLYSQLVVALRNVLGPAQAETSFLVGEGKQAWPRRVGQPLGREKD